MGLLFGLQDPILNIPIIEKAHRLKRKSCTKYSYFAGLTKNHYRDGIMALEHRWNKCISLREIMLKNKNNFEIKTSFLQC